MMMTIVIAAAAIIVILAQLLLLYALLQVYLGMSFLFIGSSKLATAYITRKWFLTGMCANMSCEMV